MKKIIAVALLALVLVTSAFAAEGKHLGQSKHSSGAPKHHKKKHNKKYHHDNGYHHGQYKHHNKHR